MGSVRCVAKHSARAAIRAALCGLRAATTSTPRACIGGRWFRARARFAARACTSEWRPPRCAPRRCGGGHPSDEARVVAWHMCGTPGGVVMLCGVLSTDTELFRCVNWAHGFAVGCIAMVDGSAALCRPRSHNLRIACVFHWEVVFDLNPFCCTGLEPQCAGVRNSTVQQCVSDIATMLSASLGAAQLLGVGQSGPCLRVLRTNSSRFFPDFGG